MKSQTLNFRTFNMGAHCRDCDFRHYADKLMSCSSFKAKVRRHVVKEGHAVEVYKETAQLIKPITS